MRPFRTFLATLLLACTAISLSYNISSAQGFVWAQAFADSTNEEINVSICTTDGNNNGYFVGSFSGTTDFDPGVGVMNVAATSDYDMFILKKDPSGNLLWMKVIKAISADSGMCFGQGIGLDSLGNIYIAGSFRDTFDFDPGSGVHLLGAYSSGYYFNTHAYVLKLSPSGDFIWVKDIGSQTTLANIGIQSMKIDAAANIFFTCSFSSPQPTPVDVDPGPGVHNILSQSNGDLLIEKLDSAGNFVWAKVISGTGYQNPSALAVDRMSNVYITGQQDGTADFDPGAGVVNLSGNEDVFIAKYDSAGNYQWAGSLTGGWNDRSYDIDTDTFGNVVATGYWSGSSIDLDPGPGVYTVTSSFTHNGFVVKLRSDGSFAWATKDYLYDGGTAVAVNGEGSVYVATGASLIEKLDSTGNLVWFKFFELDEFAYVHNNDITVDNTNEVYVVGSYGQNFSYGVDFDPGPGSSLPPWGEGGYIVKLCGTSLDLAITANDDTLCPAGDIVQITTPMITGATYTWTCNGLVYNVGSSNTITANIAGIWEVYVNGGCPSASGTPIYIYNCDGNLTSVAETNKAADIVACPNPFNDAITLQGSKVGDRVHLLDVTGRVIQRWKCTMSTETLTINDVSPGYYILRIENVQGEVKANLPVIRK